MSKSARPLSVELQMLDFALSRCATVMAKQEEGASELASEDVRAIEDLHNRWIEAELAGNSAAVLRLCTEDVVWVPPDSPLLEGRDEISEWLQSAEVEIRSLEISDLRIRGGGTVAYKTANYTTTYRPAGSSDLIEAKGTHLWILRKVGKLGWRVALVTWSAPADH